MGLLSGLFSAVGGGLIDDFFGKKKEGRAQGYQDPAKIRERYEAAGLNPLLAFQGNGAGTIAPSVGTNSAASSLIAAALDRDSNEKIARGQLEQENRRLELAAEELALKERGTSVYASNSTLNGVGGGVAISANGGPVGAPARRLPSDPATTGLRNPTRRLPEEDQGAYAPEELAMANLDRGTFWQWADDVASDNPPPGFDSWSQWFYGTKDGKPGVPFTWDATIGIPGWFNSRRNNPRKPGTPPPGGSVRNAPPGTYRPSWAN